MQNLLNDLQELLQTDERLVAEGRLVKNKIIELALQTDAHLLKMLLKNDTIKANFFTDVEGILVFDKIKFMRFVANKQFLPDSYTAYKNKIGLIREGDYYDDYLTTRNDVVLAWPYKDAILQGGQTKEDDGRDEVFWNETLAPDQIDRLLYPKVFTNWKKYSTDEVRPLSPDENINFDQENFIIKGNNLLVLHSLKKRYAGKVKFIYIDPPYNTGNDSFMYNDNFNHSTWLTFMKNRLKVARELLSKDGSIWINIDDDESHYLKVICDEVFGRENFVSNLIWQKKFAPQNDAKWFSDNHDHILVIAKNKEIWRPNLLPRTAEMDSRYKNPDNDPRGVWSSDNLLVKTYSKEYDYPIINPAGRSINPPNGSCWRVSKSKFKDLLKDNRVWFGEDGDNVPRLKRFLNEVKQGLTPLTIFSYNEVGHTQEARQEINNLFQDNYFTTPKPERLLQRIIHIGSDKNDLVLDFFVGSGTTAAVAHKMNRRYIGVEQLDYIEPIPVARLQKVIGAKVKFEDELHEKLVFDEGGISKAVNWKGGGSFIYCELLQYNQKYIDQIIEATTKEMLLAIWEDMRENAFLNYLVDRKKIDDNIKDFKALDLMQQKQFLFKLLDKNQLYLSYGEMTDETYKVSEADQQLNDKFYKK